jgi:hypothetical protein
MSAMRLLLDERILADGRHVRTWARVDADDPSRWWLADDDTPGHRLSVSALDRVMCRFGKPLANDVTPEPDALVLRGGTLRRLRHHAPVDATGRDYLVWEREGQDPLAALGATVAAALRYVVTRLTATTEN